MNARLDEDVIKGTVADLAKSLPDCLTLKMPLPAPAPICANFIDRLVVFDELSPAAETDPYGWSPLPTDRTRLSGPLADWFLLPRRGPDEMVLPGYHTACEGLLKKIDAARRNGRGVITENIAPGNEIFLSLCGMMATGTRTVLLSRWRSGGQTSLDLAREFTQELPHTTPADSWQRAVQVVRNSTLNIEAEPRISKKTAAELAEDGKELRAVHPFFWAGFLLADSGCPMPQPEANAAAGKK